MGIQNISALDWPKRAVVYQIYPRSFKDSNGDGIGDLPGITSQLDYLCDLGVGAIWLSPVYKSPMADFGYDISDYKDIDPSFGRLQDFKVLLEETHKRGIKLIMDFVPNHTSDQHPWFVESKSSKNNSKRDWYIWAEGRGKNQPPNNWLSVFGGSGWEWDESSGQYYYHSFLKQQPDLNWHNREVREAMADVLRFWLDLGVDGFRVDAVHWLIKDLQLLDNPVNPNFSVGKGDPYNQALNIYNQGQEETLKIVHEFCMVLKEYGEKFLVTELHADVPGMMKYYRASDSGLHSPFNFNLIGMPWDAQTYKRFVDEFEAALDARDWPNYVLGNHDKPRVASRLGQQRAKAAALLQFTLRGMPFVYYGEELGMEDGVIPPEMVQDPFEKNVPGFRLGRDPQRTPMQWDGSLNAGFSPVNPWLPVHENYQHINAEVEKRDSRSMWNLYKFLIHFRGSTPALLTGKYQPMDLQYREVFAFLRVGEKEKYLVAVNFSSNPQTLSLDFPTAEIIVTTYGDRPKGEKAHLNNFSLRGEEGYLFKLGR